MAFLDLPIELVRDILNITVVSVGLYEAVKLRSVCKVFDIEIENSISAKNLLDFRRHPRLAGFRWNQDLHSDCVRYLSQPHEKRKCKPHGISRRYLTRYLFDRVIAGKVGGHFLDTIRQTVEQVLKETGEVTESKRVEYTIELCRAATENLEICLVLDYSKPQCCLRTAEELADSSQLKPLNTHHFLVAAAYLDLPELVCKLLEQNGIEALGTSIYFGSPLVVAARRGHPELVRIFLEYGMSPNRETPGNPWINQVFAQTFDETPLQQAALYGHGDIISLILEPRYKCDVSGDPYDEAICNAARGGHGSIVKYLLEHVTTVRSYNLEEILLCEAARYGREDLVIELLERLRLSKNTKAMETEPQFTLSVGASERLAQPALCLAAYNGHAGVVRIILSHLCSKEGRISKYRGPHSMYRLLYQTIQLGFKSVVQVLLDFGVDLNHPPPGSHPYWDGAAWRGNEEMLYFLLENGVKPSAKPVMVEVAVMRAAHDGFLGVLRFFKHCGRDMNRKIIGSSNSLPRALIAVRDEIELLPLWNQASFARPEHECGELENCRLRRHGLNAERIRFLEGCEKCVPTYDCC